MSYCSVVTVLALVGLTKKCFGHYAILKRACPKKNVKSITFTFVTQFGANFEIKLPIVY